MFKPASPPKEGRTQPGTPRYKPASLASRNRRTQTITVVLCALAFGWFIVHLLTSGSSSLPRTPSGGGRGTAPLGQRPPKVEGAAQPPKVEDHVQKDPPVKVQEPKQAPADGEKAASEDDSDAATEAPEVAIDPVPAKPKSKPAPTTPKPKSPQSAEGIEKVQRALNKVVNMLPDEVHMRELLRPFENGGKERMRELGLRTRSYKRFFDAWEDLHVVQLEEGEGAGEAGQERLALRDDIIQLLQSGELLPEPDFSLAHTIHSYEAFRAFVAKFAHSLYPWTTPYFADHMALHAHVKNGGKGIVLTAGDDQAQYLVTIIWSLRKLGCDLPVEVMYLGDRDLGEDYRAELEEMKGVVTRDIAQMVNDEGWDLAGWAAKPFAMLLSSFREVIFIDADSFFMKNPNLLFEEPGYKSTGALFFRDRMIMPESKKRFLQQLLPKPVPKAAKQSRFWSGDSGHQQESGVVVVDKYRHFIAMLLVCRLNGSDRDTKDGKTGVYELMYGDKETFWLGFLLAGDEKFAFHMGDTGSMGINPTEIKPKPVETPKKPEDEKAKVEKEKAKEKEKEADKDKKVDEKKKDDEQKKDDEKKKKDDTPSATAPKAEKPLMARDAPAEPTAYKLCAPQLLHTHTDGTPYWFNGGLVDNKFADKDKRKWASFESYLVEPKQQRDPTPWQLGASNMACLTTDPQLRFDFTPEEKEHLKALIEHANTVIKARD